MDTYRFFAPGPWTSPIPLPEDQAHHAIHVLRLETGAPVVVFDGQGQSAEGTLAVQGKRASVKVVRTHQDLPNPIRLTLATAAPKTDRAEQLIDQASQLNVATVAWLDCDRSVVKPRESGNKMDKWHRVAVESAKQCGRNRLLSISPMRKLQAVLAEPADAVLWLEPRQGRRMHEVLAEIAPIAADGAGKELTISALIGPEGGWSDGEIELLSKTAGIHRVRLTPTVLRIETAAAAVAAIINAW